jgi:hypothetical protein
MGHNLERRGPATVAPAHEYEARHPSKSETPKRRVRKMHGHLIYRHAASRAFTSISTTFMLPRKFRRTLHLLRVIESTVTV